MKTKGKEQMISFQELVINSGGERRTIVVPVTTTVHKQISVPLYGHKQEKGRDQVISVPLYGSTLD
jgi:hypothetical protein